MGGDLVGIWESVGEELFFRIPLPEAGVMLLMLGTRRDLNGARPKLQDEIKQTVSILNSADRSWK